MKTLRNRHIRNRTYRRNMKGGAYREDLALITKYVDIGQTEPLVPSDMRPAEEELSAMKRIMNFYPTTAEFKERFQNTLRKVGLTGRKVGYGQPLKDVLARTFAGELGELKAVIEANPPPERQANTDFYIPLQRLHRIAFEFSNSLNQADANKLRRNKEQYQRVKQNTDNKQPAEQDAANAELVHSVAYFAPELAEWFRGLAGLKNIQIRDRPAERERLFSLLPPGLQASQELQDIFDNYSRRIGEVFIDLTRTSVAPQFLPEGARPNRPGRKVLPEPIPDEPLAAAASVPLPASAPGTPNTGESRAPPKEIPPISLASVPEPLLAAPPSQILSSAPPRRGDRVGKPVGALAEPAANPLLTSQSSPAGPIVSPPQEPTLRRDYIAPQPATPQPPPSNAAPELSLTSFFSALLPRKEVQPSTPQSQLPALDPGISSQPRIPLGEVNPLRRGTPLQPQPTPAVPGLKSEEQKAFEKGAYQSIDTSKSLCERLHPRLYEILKTGQFNGKSIFTMINQQDPELTDFFTEIGFDIADKTLMGHPISEIYKACHPDRTIDDPNLTTIFQVLQALYNYTRVKAPVLNLPPNLNITSQPAPALGGPGSKPENPDKKTPASAPPAGVKIFRQPVQKQLFKRGDRVIINKKGQRNIERFPPAVRAAMQETTCNDPFYATVEVDQKVGSSYVRIICDKGGRYNEEDENLTYIPPGPAKLTITPAQAPTQPTPVVPLEESAAPVRRGQLQATKSPSSLGTPATISDCDEKLIGMTHRATVCETELARLRAECDAVIERNTAETERLQASIAQEKSRLAALQTSKSEVEQNLKSATQTERTLRDYIGKYGRQLGEFRTKIDGLEREKAGLDAQIKSINLELAESKVEEGKMQARFLEINQQLQPAQASHDDLSDRLLQTYRDIASIEASISDLKSRFSTTEALITAADERIRNDLGTITRTLTEGVGELSAGLNRVSELAQTTRGDIAASRQEFSDKFSSLQRDLTSSNLAGRNAILAAIAELRASNQASMATLQQDLAGAIAQRDQLQAQISEEQSAKARMQGELQAKIQEMGRKDQEHAQALETARQLAEASLQQVKEALQAAAEAKDQASAAEAGRLREVYAGNLEDLSTRLSAAVARAQVAEGGNQERAALAEELARVRAQIAAIPPPVVIPPPAIAPKILRREPADEVRTGDIIRIIWEPNGTAGPWILRIDYDGINSDFQEVTMEGPITYTIKRPGALSGRIYNIKQV